MDFLEEITALATRAADHLDHLETEEATKNALVLPFIRTLGYDIFDPQEVVPAYTMPSDTKEYDSLDYAVQLDGEPVLLIECRHVGANLLNDHPVLLSRYFQATSARIGVFTNGTTYRFYTDLENDQKMDERPFLATDLLDVDEREFAELKRLRKSTLDLDEMRAAAHDLKYRHALHDYLNAQWTEPDEDFVRFLTEKVYVGRVTDHVQEEFEDIVRGALQQFVHEKIQDRLTAALSQDADEPALETNDTAMTLPSLRAEDDDLPTAAWNRV
jgi:hypothetical protein